MREPRNYQAEFWNEMLQLKAHVEYLHVHHEASAKVQHSLNAALAVLSGLGLAVWVVLGEAAEFWAALFIVVSAIAHALMPYLPYQRRMSDTADLKAELQGLLLQAERQWYEVSEGLLDNQQINRLTINIREQKATLERAYFKTGPLPRNEEYLATGEKDAERYFNTHYPTG